MSTKVEFAVYCENWVRSKKGVGGNQPEVEEAVRDACKGCVDFTKCKPTVFQVNVSFTGQPHAYVQTVTNFGAAKCALLKNGVNVNV